MWNPFQGAQTRKRDPVCQAGGGERGWAMATELSVLEAGAQPHPLWPEVLLAMASLGRVSSTCGLLQQETAA